MRALIIISISIIAVSGLHAQSLKKYQVGNSGCSAYFFCNPGAFALEKSPDSSYVYTAECVGADSLNYGIICLKFSASATTSDLQTAEDVLISYLDYLKTSLNIVSAAGYGKGHRLKNREDTRGVIDYWKDKDGYKWKIKGWTNGKNLAVLYVYSKGDLPETRVNIFLDGLVLPGM